MKTKLILSIGLLALLCLPLRAQTTPGITNVDTGTAFLDSLTNVALVPYGAYNQTTHKVGGGLMAVYNITDKVATGAGIEGLGNSLQAINANLQFKLPIKPFKFIGWDQTFVPWAGAFIGTPVSGAGSSDGSLSAGAGGGLYTPIVDLGKGWNLGAGAGVVQWTGGGHDWAGTHILGFLEVSHGL